jgi:hypothetical protein
MAEAVTDLILTAVMAVYVTAVIVALWKAFSE